MKPRTPRLDWRMLKVNWPSCAAAGAARADDRNLRRPQRRRPLRVHLLEVVDRIGHRLTVDLDARLVGIRRTRLGGRARRHRRGADHRRRGCGALGRRDRRHRGDGLGPLLFEGLHPGLQVLDRAHRLVERGLELFRRRLGLGTTAHGQSSSRCDRESSHACLHSPDVDRLAEATTHAIGPHAASASGTLLRHPRTALISINLRPARYWPLVQWRCRSICVFGNVFGNG